MGKLIVKKGDKFHNWTVIAEVKSLDGRKFLCINSEGIKRIVRLSLLRSGESKGLSKKELLEIRISKKTGFQKGHPNYLKEHTKKTIQKMKDAWRHREPMKEETKEKISKSLTGEKHPNYGKHRSEETKEKLRIANTGKKVPMDIVLKIVETRRKNGSYKQTEETKKKIGIANKGKNKPPRSEEHKRKLKENNAHYWKGKTRPEETRKKLSESKKGDKNPNWKDGISPENHRIRTSCDYRDWRKKVFTRDNFICQKYKIDNVIIQCHHIKNFAEYPELRFNTNNGITLSKKAHEEFHIIYGKKNNTKEQLEKFLN